MIPRDISGTRADGRSDRTAPPARRNFVPFFVPWVAIVALEIEFMAGLRIAESDIWFHLRNVRELLQNHSFLRSDLYTFTSAGAPLINHEWLAELPYYFAFQAGGQRGLLAVYLVALWLIFAGVYYLACRRGANYADAAIVTLVGVALGSYSFGPRMHHLGWLCMALLLLALDRFERTGKGLWCLPPLFALWVNLHGSWLFGFVVIGLYIASGLVEGSWWNVTAERWPSAKLKKLLGMTGLSILALFVNPYGYRLVWYPFDLMLRQKSNLQNVVEWQSVNFQSLPGKMALLMVFAVLAAAWFSPRRWRLLDVLLIAFALFVSLLHVRLLIFAAMVLIPILGPRLQLFLPYDAAKDKPWLNLALILVIIFMMAGLYPSAATLEERVYTQFPRGALAFMQQKQINGRLFHYYDFGGYIEWYAPAIKTFADGRTDIFVYNGVFDDYLAANTLQRPFEILDKYNIEYVMFPRGKQISYLLDRSDRWRVIYQDAVVKLYHREPGNGSP